MAIVIDLEVKAGNRSNSLAKLEAKLKSTEHYVVRLGYLWDRATSSVNRYNSAVRSLSSASSKPITPVKISSLAKIDARSSSLAKLEANLKSVEDRTRQLEEIWNRANAAVQRYGASVRELASGQDKVQMPIRAVSVAKLESRSNSLSRLEAKLQQVEIRTIRLGDMWDRATSSVQRYSAAVRGLPLPSLVPAGNRAPAGNKPARNPGGRAPDSFDVFQSLSRLNSASGGKMQPLVNAAANQALADLQGQNTAAALRKITTIQAAQLKQANQPNPILQAILTSRFNVGGSGGGVSPLIGRTLKAIGPALLRLSVAAGPAGIAIAVLGAAALAASYGLAKMSAVTIESAKMLKSIGQGRAATGGSFEDFESLRAAARISGSSPEAIASQISEALQSGAGAVVAQKLGISTVRGGFGDMNDAAAANKVINAIANAGSRAEADRIATQVNDKSLAQFFDLTPGEKQLIAESAAAAPSERSIRAGRELSAQMDRLGAAFERLLRSAPVVLFMETLAKVVEIFASSLDAYVQIFNLIGRVLGVGADNRPNVQKEHAEAMKAHTKALRDFGTFGGGQRAASALPSGIKGEQYGYSAVRNQLGGSF